MKFPFFFKNPENDQSFLGLFLKGDEGIALIMTKEQGSLVVKEKEKFTYTNGWENLTEDVDEVLYRLEKKHNIEINKTIFFVYSHLVDERSNDIKKPFLTKIKELVKNLELEVLGYIECFEAVSYYLEKKEEVRLTAVLLELDKNQLSIFVYKGGKINYRKSIARTDNIIDDFLTATNDIKGRAMLPSRMILYDSGKIDEAATKIISHRWSEDYFAQIPKIDILQEDQVIEGLIDVFSGQIKTKEPEVEEKSMPVEDDFGFVVGKDIGEVKNDVVQEEFKPKIKLNLPKFSLPKIALPKIDWSFLKVLKGRAGVILGIVIILSSLLLNELFFHKAQLIVYLPAQTIKKSLTEEVEYKTASTSAEYTEATATTGKRQIGEAAKGSVNIHNFDDNERIFNKGTLLSVNSLEFILDTEVKVASATVAADGSAKLPGKTAGAITASNIGPEGNLAKNQRFKIDDLAISDFFAINDSALTGGSRKEIRTVSEDDQEKLVDKIITKAKKEAKAPSLTKEEAVVTELTEAELEDEEYTKEVGEEATDLSLTAKVMTSFYSYNRDGLNKKILDELKGEIKSGFKIIPGALNYKITSAEVNDDLLLLDLDINTKAVREFDSDEVLNKITGRNKSQLETILKSNNNVQAYDIVISEPIPFLKNFLPFFSKNITLKISSL